MGKNKEKKEVEGQWSQKEFVLPPLPKLETLPPPPLKHVAPTEDAYKQLASIYGVDASTVRDAEAAFGDRFLLYLDHVKEFGPDIARSLMGLQPLPEE